METIEARAPETEGRPGALKIKKIAIVGLPNTGKSQVFNNLTGEYTIVANYPGTTIEIKRTVALIGGQYYEIIDTPGLHCLHIHSEEEIVVRDMLFSEEPDIVIQCMDANQYKQSLKLTVELLELEIPMIIVLNAFDEAARKGVWVDPAELERFLGVTVVESEAIRGLGKEELKKAVSGARRSSLDLQYGFKIENEVTDLAAELPLEMGFKQKIASLLLLRDPYLEKFLEKKIGKAAVTSLIGRVASARRRIKNNIRTLIEDKRSFWVDQAVAVCVRRRKSKWEGFSHHAASASRHPVLGIPIFLFFLSVAYLCVVNVSGFLEARINSFVVKPALSAIASLGLPVFWDDLLIGNHGLLTIGVFNAVCTVLPILSVFFFIFGIFEDSGYMANFCVFSKRIFEKIGVSGKAITSLVLGFACKTTATLNTKGLTSFKEKLITVFLITFAIPCSAQLGLSMVILAKVGLAACLIAFGTLALFEVGAGFFLNAVIKQDGDTCFIQAIPAMRFPNLKAVLVKTYHRVVWFFQESLPVFIIAAAVLFIFDKIGLLYVIKKTLNPLIIGWMGLPSDILDVFMLGLASRAASSGLMLNMVNSGALSYAQSIIAVVVTTTFFPCFPNVIAIAKRMGVMTAAAVSALVCVSSLVLGGVLHWILVFSMRF